MSQKPVTQRAAAEKVVRGIRRAPRKQHSAEKKIRIVLAGLRGEDSIAEPVGARASRIACTTAVEGVPRTFFVVQRNYRSGAPHLTLLLPWAAMSEPRRYHGGRSVGASEI